MKKVLITQSNYIPWKGYFDAIRSVDEVVLLDDVQFTRRDWRNRNQIKTPQGPLWLTIPVESRGKYEQSIWETRIADPTWAKSHWKCIAQNYARAPYFREVSPAFEDFYQRCEESQLSLVNRGLIELVMATLGVRVPISWSHEHGKFEDPNERLIGICRSLGATDYYSGPAAKTYMDTAAFENAGLRVHWLSYDNYPEYPQLHGSFIHNVSILDLLFQTGLEALHYLNREKSA